MKTLEGADIDCAPLWALPLGVWQISLLIIQLDLKQWHFINWKDRSDENQVSTQIASIWCVSIYTYIMGEDISWEKLAVSTMTLYFHLQRVQ